MRVPTELIQPPTASLLPNCVLCCPRVANEVNTAFQSCAVWGPLCLNKEGSVETRPFPLVLFTPLQPLQHSYFLTFALAGHFCRSLPGTLFPAFPHGGHLLILQLPDAMTPPLFNQGSHCCLCHQFCSVVHLYTCHHLTSHSEFVHSLFPQQSQLQCLAHSRCSKVTFGQMTA